MTLNRICQTKDTPTFAMNELPILKVRGSGKILTKWSEGSILACQYLRHIQQKFLPCDYKRLQEDPGQHNLRAVTDLKQPFCDYQPSKEGLRYVIWFELSKLPTEYLHVMLDLLAVTYYSRQTPMWAGYAYTVFLKLTKELGESALSLPKVYSGQRKKGQKIKDCFSHSK